MERMRMMGKYGYMGILAAMMLLAACSNTGPAEKPAQENPQVERPQVEEDAQVEQPTEASVEEPAEEPIDEGMPPTAREAATTVLRALKSGNMEAVAAWAHPERGVRFSPYAYVDTETDQVLTREELSDAMASTAVRVWREYAGNGDMIELTYADYHKKFVYDANFLDDAEVGLNESLGEGTTINNLNEVYPPDTHDYVEFHIDGIDPTYEGMDWRSLRLVFEKNGMDRTLVGIVHDQWTP
jgi:hypothetical protein